MGDGKGECCIARWGGGHVADTSKMDMIMLKFRPIAPKPVSGCTTASECGGSGSGSGSGRQAKAGGRARKKTSKENSYNNSNNKKCNNNNNNGRKRKSSSPDRKQEDYNNNNINQTTTDLTLLPLFPEAPDLSPTSQYDEIHHHQEEYSSNNNIGNNCNSLSFEGNYNNCHVSWW